MKLNSFTRTSSALWNAPGDPPSAAPTEPQPPNATPEPAPQADYSWAPKDFVKDGQFDAQAFRSHYDEIVSERAQWQESRAEVPESPDGYEFALPDKIDYGDLDLPEGFAVELRTDDPAMQPIFKEFGGLLHKYGIPKGAAQEFMGLLAKYEAAGASQLHAMTKAETQALGPGAESRRNAVMNRLTNSLSEDLVAALKPVLSYSAGVKALEKLLAPRSVPNPSSSQPPGPDLSNLRGYELLKAARATSR